MRIRVAYIGRPRSRALNEAAAEYARRLERFCDFAQVELRELRAAKQLSEKFRGATIVALDPAGREMDSAAFARWLDRVRAGGAVRGLVFLVGGADGLPPALRDSCELISLSRLTLPHELARVLLLEQLYRAFATLHGHPYPR